MSHIDKSSFYKNLDLKLLGNSRTEEKAAKNLGKAKLPGSDKTLQGGRKSPDSVASTGILASERVDNSRTQTEGEKSNESSYIEAKLKTAIRSEKASFKTTQSRLEPVGLFIDSDSQKSPKEFAIKIGLLQDEESFPISVAIEPTTDQPETESLLITKDDVQQFLDSKLINAFKDIDGNVLLIRSANLKTEGRVSKMYDSAKDLQKDQLVKQYAEMSDTFDKFDLKRMYNSTDPSNEDMFKAFNQKSIASHSGFLITKTLGEPPAYQLIFRLDITDAQDAGKYNPTAKRVDDEPGLVSSEKDSINTVNKSLEGAGSITHSHHGVSSTAAKGLVGTGLYKSNNEHRRTFQQYKHELQSMLKSNLLPDNLFSTDFKSFLNGEGSVAKDNLNPIERLFYDGATEQGGLMASLKISMQLAAGKYLTGMAMVTHCKSGQDRTAFIHSLNKAFEALATTGINIGDGQHIKFENLEGNEAILAGKIFFDMAKQATDVAKTALKRQDDPKLKIDDHTQAKELKAIAKSNPKLFAKCFVANFVDNLKDASPGSIIDGLNNIESGLITMKMDRDLIDFILQEIKDQTSKTNGLFKTTKEEKNIKGFNSILVVKYQLEKADGIEEIVKKLKERYDKLFENLDDEFTEKVKIDLYKPRDDALYLIPPSAESPYRHQIGSFVDAWLK